MGTILITLMGGLGLFITGMNMMSRGIERVAGSKMRSILERLTKNRFIGVFVGLLFTAIIQSSSTTTVMAVSFVNAGLMKLSEAAGIILGANIGTTVTALLVSFKLSAIAPIFVLAGAVMVNFIKKPIIRKSGEVVLGFGVLFVGISTMSAAMGSLKDIDGVVEALASFKNPVLAVLLGLVITSVVQSSSVTISILVVMGAQGLVDLRLCMFVILGCNIGACTSAVLASLGAKKDAKRASLIHLLFNIFGNGVMFFVILFFEPQTEAFVRLFSKGGDLGREVAMANIVFKVVQVIVIYPFMNAIIKLTYRLVKGEDEAEDTRNFHVKYITQHGLPNRSVAVPNAVREMQRMADMAFKNIDDAMNCMLACDEEAAQKVYETEEYIDYLAAEISAYLVRANQNTLPLADAKLISAYFHVVNDIERIGDHAENFVDFIHLLKENNRQFSPESVAELREMMSYVDKILKESIDMFVTGNESNMQEIMDLEEKIDNMEEELQDAHIKRLAEGKCNAQTGVYFSDIISGLERVGDHAINIAFSVIEAQNAE